MITNAGKIEPIENDRERSFLDLRGSFRYRYINHPSSMVRELGVVGGGRVRNEICPMSTNGLSPDHVQAFNLLSSLRLQRKLFLSLCV